MDGVLFGDIQSLHSIPHPICTVYYLLDVIYIPRSALEIVRGLNRQVVETLALDFNLVSKWNIFCSSVINYYYKA